MNENSLENKTFVIKKLDDLRGLDLSKKDLRNISVDVLITTEFDSGTTWPSKEKLPANFDPNVILENGKKPGLGLKELHKQGTTGRGIHVAIIDQELDLKHHEYIDNIVSAEQIGEPSDGEVSMHGPAVASFFVGKNCGVAPEASLHYFSVPSGDYSNWEFYTNSLYEIINYNKTAEDKDKIRVVSVSIGYNPAVGGNLENWKDAIQIAKNSGVVFIDSNVIADSNFTGGGSSSDKDNINTYEPWLAVDDSNKEKGISTSWNKDRIIIPSDFRSFASSWNKKNEDGPDEYCFNGVGGFSWAIPYLAGIFTLMLQINKNLKIEEMVKIINETTSVNEKGLKIVNPKGIIDKVSSIT